MLERCSTVEKRARTGLEQQNRLKNSIDEALKLLGSHWSIEGSLELITINTPPLEATKSLFPATLGAAKSLIQLDSSDLEHLRLRFVKIHDDMEPTDIENVSSNESHGGEKRKSKQQPTQKQIDPKKTKARKSTVWDEFEKFTNEEGNQKARCIHCSKALAGDSSKNGTSTLRRHLNICQENPKKLKDQTNLFVKKNDDVDIGSSVKTWKFCAQRSRNAIAEMVILDELSFASLEHEEFRRLLEIVCPNLKFY
ncbi:hypothetical protein E3N88_32083 [Mikania micrantha]|uniref:BED-type domain-containing protein n=1 Tax=Mikania micrantha TaxID=192012 RepID=A0A5N6M7I3_9ASTR|nr:hypothetical protein E3N88_32083 [Mikania micrantha]